MGLSEKDKEVYIQGLQKLIDHGVTIYIDGEESREGDLHKILQVREDSAFYMGDYIEDVSSGTLKEIRFDMVKINKKGGIDRSG